MYNMVTASRFTAIPLEQILPDQPLPGDIFLFVSGHFVKYRIEGSSISSEKYNDFVIKRLQFVFSKDYEIERFEKWYQDHINKEKKSLEKRIGGNPEKIIEDRQEIKAELQRIFTGESGEIQSTVITEKTRRFVDKMAQSPLVQKGIARLTTYSNTLSDHSVNVATLSVYLAFHMGYCHQIILENLYTGALFHDYGKTRVDPTKLEGKDIDYIKQLMKNHPSLGRSALRARADMADEVLNIIGEHHERNDGKGYPKKLKGGRIYDLTKIVSIANYFDHLVVLSDKSSIKEKQMDAIKKMAPDKGRMFDPQKLSKCLKILEKGLG